tara:strand:- start:1019 stop:1192 length:174 start_codon:yes stop_codon:yes gene_type:complete
MAGTNPDHAVGQITLEDHDLPRHPRRLPGIDADIHKSKRDLWQGEARKDEPMEQHQV